MIKEERGVKYEILYTSAVSNFRVNKSEGGIYYIELNHALSDDYKKRAVERCINDIVKSKTFSKSYLRNLIDVVGRGKRHKVVVQEGYIFLFRVKVGKDYEQTK